MRPAFARETAWGYPVFATITGSFGYWLNGVGQRQSAMLEMRRQSLLEKRKRQAERDARGEGIAV
jgi:hypothetical protein